MPRDSTSPLTLLGLIYREIRFRKWSFLLATFAVAAAASLIFGSEALLRLEQLLTQQILQQQQDQAETSIREHEERVAAAGAKLQDTVRKQMLTLGFNILILPKDVDVAKLHMDSTVSETMPYSYAEKIGTPKPNSC